MCRDRVVFDSCHSVRSASMQFAKTDDLLKHILIYQNAITSQLSKGSWRNCSVSHKLPELYELGQASLVGDVTEWVIMACNAVGLLACGSGKENGESICMGMLHKKFSLRRGTPSLLLVCPMNHCYFVSCALDKTTHTYAVISLCRSPQNHSG